MFKKVMLASALAAMVGMYSSILVQLFAPAEGAILYATTACIAGFIGCFFGALFSSSNNKQTCL